MNDGILEPDGDRWRLRFTRTLRHPPERVWKALTEAHDLAAWFPQRIEGEWRVGARLKFASEYGDFDGEVLDYRPPALLEFRWGTDVLRFEVMPDGGGTVLTLIDSFAELGKGARDAAGWHVILDGLAGHLDGKPQGSKPGENWSRVHQVYVARFGPEAATIGPPPKPAVR